MDYKEKYEEALERARKLGTIEMPIDPMRSIQEQIFPELKESEDERIRNFLIDFIKACGWSEKQFPPREDCIAWLEKQKELTDEENEQGKDDVLWCIKQARQHAKDENEMGTCWFAEKWLEKQKPIEHFELKAGHWYFCHQAYCCRADDLTVKEGERFMCEKDGVVKGFIIKDPEKYFKEVCAPSPMEDEQKYTDKVEQKFKVGDWIINNDKRIAVPTQILEIEDYGYVTSRGYTSFDKVKTDYHSWTIQDAKGGDVLKEDSCTFIIERMKPDGTAIVRCCLFDDGDFDLMGSTLSFDVDNTYPATKEQRDILFQKMHEVGYEWDAEKKELKKIELKKIEQNPAWNEEDERNLKGIIDEIEANKDNAPDYDIATYDRFLSWLKSLKDRVQPQCKQEWSEDDSWMLNVCCNAIDSYKEPVDKYLVKNWLKSLKPNHYKPTS